MKAILEFNFDDENLTDEFSHYRCIRSLDMAMALWDIKQSKKGLEYSLDGKELDKYEVLDLIFDKFYEILDDNNLSIDKLMR